MTYTLDDFQTKDYGEIAPQQLTVPPVQYIDLDCGVVIKICELHQTYTYAGMLCGNHLAPLLPMHVDYTLSKAKEQFSKFSGDKVAVFLPVVATGVYARKIPTTRNPDRLPWAKLPEVTCITVLREKSQDNYVVAIWWQDEMGYPPPAIIEQIKALDWRSRCTEVDP
jgi:hypothetical protein